MKLRGITIKLLIIVTFMVLIFLSNTVYATTNEIEDRSDTEVVSYNLETQVEVVETYDNSITMHRAGYNSIIPNYEPKTKQRVIVGNDDRNGMMSINKYPYSATCLIISYYSDGTSYMGSGAIISQDKVLTSGHNLYDYDKKLWVTSVDVIPTAFGGTEFSNILIKPYGTTYSKQVWVGSTYKSYNDPRGDWGVISLADPIGNETGWYGLQGYGDASNLNNKTAVSRGYPVLNKYRLYFEMYEAPGRIYNVTSHMFDTDIDVEKGQSGSPVCLTSNDAFVVGIIKGTAENGIENVAVRLSNQLVDTIRDLINK